VCYYKDALAELGDAKFSGIDLDQLRPVPGASVCVDLLDTPNQCPVALVFALESEARHVLEEKNVGTDEVYDL
jgi:hypothetical protein